MLAGYGRRQPVNPPPHRAHALWRHCKYAFCAAPWNGWERIHTAAGMDNVTRGLGRMWNGTNAPGSIGNAGKALNSTGADSFVWEDFDYIMDNKHGVFRWIDSGGASIACLFRLNSIPAADRPIFTKRFGNQFYFHGLSFFYDVATSRFRFYWCDATTQEFLASDFAPVANKTYLLVGTHTGSMGRKAEFWIDGKRVAVNNATGSYPAYEADPPLALFYDSQNGIGDGRAFMAGLWGRPLATSEINALSTDPYIMWKDRPKDYSIPFAAPPGVPYIDPCDECSVMVGGANAINVVYECDGEFFGMGDNPPPVPVAPSDDCDNCCCWFFGAKSRRTGKI